MSIEAMKQALEALENCTTWNLTRAQFDKNVTAITSLRTAIEQAEKQEPVAKVVLTETLDLPCLQWLDLNRQFDFKGGEYLYTTPPAQEFVCSTGLCHFTLTQTNVGIGERGMEAYEAAKKRCWVGVSDERLMEMPKQEPEKLECINCAAFGECHPNNDAGRCGYEPPAAQRQWVGLTDDEQLKLAKNSEGKTRHWLVWEVEAKLKEKNA